MAVTRLKVDDNVEIELFPVHLPGAESQYEEVGIEESIEVAMEKVEEAVVAMGRKMSRALNTLQAGADAIAPQEVTWEFGIAITVGGNILLMTGEEKAHFKVTATWR